MSFLSPINRFRWAVALPLVALGFGINLAARSFDLRIGYFLGTAVVVASAYWGGFLSGLLATVLCVVLGSYFHIEPIYSLAVADPRDRMLLGLFLVEGIFLSAFSSKVPPPRPILSVGELGRYAAAAVAVILATAIKLPVSTATQEDIPFMLFYAAIVFSAWYGGLGPGLFATALAALAAHYLFSYPLHLRDEGRSEAFQLGLFTIEGGILTLFGTTIYVARWKAEQSARRAEAAEERYKHLVEGVRDHAIFLLDSAGRVASWNPAAERVLGYSEEEALRHPFSDFFSTEDQQTHQPDQVLDKAARPGGSERAGWCVRRNGERFWAELNLARLDNQNGNGFTVVLRDVSERRRMELELERAVQRLRALSRELMQVQENERRHLARELHDELGQTLTALGLNLQAIKRSSGPELDRVEESIELLNGAIQQVRNLSLDLRPAMLDDLGLAATLRWYADRQAQRAGVEVEFTTRTDGTQVPAELVNACFRLAQEALTNVMRHSNARHVRMELDQREQGLRLTVSDDGIGFDLQEARRRTSRGESAGLAGMQERVELLGGHLEIDSAVGRGTTVRAELPVTAPAEVGAWLGGEL